MSFAGNPHGFRGGGMVGRRGGGRGRGRGRGRGGWGHHHNGRDGGGGRGRGRGGNIQNPHRGRGGGRGGAHGGGRGGGVPPRFDPSQHLPIEEIGDYDASSPEDTVTVAVEGCCHGELDAIYQRLEHHEQQTGQKIDLLLCCGDFQSHRNAADFHSSAIPPKYRSLGTFPKYYAGEEKAPILTIFIGGNHEASQPLRELHYGGWVAPNIYYLGSAGVVQYRGLRIGGISGIYKSHDYTLGHFERPPYDRSSLRSVYHVRNVDAYRMKCLSSQQPLDVMMSHDWPLGIEQHGNVQELLRKKPYFRQEIERNDLGSRPNREILDTIRPKHWFSAHLHVKFKATVQHATDNVLDCGVSNLTKALVPSQVKSSKTNTDSAEQPMWVIDTEPSTKETKEGESGASEKDEKNNTSDTATEFHGLESSSAKCGNNGGVGDLTDQMTRFLALDKCLPRRHYLSILHLPARAGNGTTTEEPSRALADGTAKEEGRDVETTDDTKRPSRLCFDPEWLAILRKTHHLTITQRRRAEVPVDLEVATVEDMEWIKSRFSAAAQSVEEPTNTANEALQIPEKFIQTVPIHSDPAFRNGDRCAPLPPMGNPQTDRLLRILELEHKLNIPYDPDLTPARISAQLQGIRSGEPLPAADSNEIDLDFIDDDDEKEVRKGSENMDRGPVVDADEIDIDDIDDEDDKKDTGTSKRARVEQQGDENMT